MGEVDISGVTYLAASKEMEEGTTEPRGGGCCDVDLPWQFQG